MSERTRTRTHVSERTRTAHQFHDSDSDVTLSPNDEDRVMTSSRTDAPTTSRQTSLHKLSVNNTTNDQRKLPLRNESDKSVSGGAGHSARPLMTVKSNKRPLDEEVNNKPMCEYGAKCYRKNPQHKADFRHPEPVSAQTASLLDTVPEPGRLTKRSRTMATDQSAPVASVNEVYAHAQPFSFYLTRVEGIHAKYNQQLTLNIKDILSSSVGKLVCSAQFNFKIEISWLMRQYPSEHRTRPLLVVHGDQGQSKLMLERDARAYPSITLCQAKLDIAYGTHHSKMMLLLYESGLRVVIHTANLYETDWKQKTQGVWMSPIFPRSDKAPDETDSATNFKRDLVQYLSAYGLTALKGWIDHVQRHDMTSARVHIVGSVPGRHQGDRKHCWGHLKLRKVLQEHGPLTSEVKLWPVIGQFSSVGSLGARCDAWLTGEFLHSLAAGQGAIGAGSEPLQLIFPSKENIRTSLEGYPAGASVPYSINVAKKQLYLHTYFHQWLSNCRERSRASPHIKSYLRMSPDAQDLAWFLVTSANLSKAAWGSQEKNGFQLMIRSYEIGVLFLPLSFKLKKFTAMKSLLQYQTGGHVFPVPYDLPPTPYGPKDRPWIWDIPYVDLADTHGNDWCPP